MLETSLEGVAPLYSATLVSTVISSKLPTLSGRGIDGTAPRQTGHRGTYLLIARIFAPYL